MHVNFKFNYYGLFLDKLQDDKEIYKNKAIVTEKIYYIIMISMFCFFGSLLFFFYYIQYKDPHLLEVMEISIAQVYSIFIWWKAANIMDKLGKANRGLKISIDLLSVQLQLVLILTIINIAIIYEVTVYYVSDMYIVFMAMGNVFLLCAIISNYMKIFLCILMEIWLLDFTYHHMNDSSFGKVYLFALHSYVLLNILFIYVQQIVLVASWEEYSERVDVSFHSMHDLRNYLYSYIELNNERDNEELKEEIQPVKCNNKNTKYNFATHNSNYVKKGSKADSDSKKNSKLNLSFSSKKNSKIDNNQSKVDSKLNKTNSLSSNNPEINNEIPALTPHNAENKIKTYGSVMLMNSYSTKSTFSNKMTQEERDEKNIQQRFILFKVCFLYHLELMFNNSYNLKPSIVDVRELCLTSSETMKVLFQNKNNNITMDVKSTVQAIDLDNTIFEYLICDIAKFFHDANYSDIKFLLFVVIKNYDLQFHIQVQVKDLQPYTINQLTNKHIIRKLIMTLNYNVSFKIQYDFNSVMFIITFPQSKEVIALMMRRKRRNKHAYKHRNTNSQGLSKNSDISNDSRHSSIVKTNIGKFKSNVDKSNDLYRSSNAGNSSAVDSSLNDSDLSFSLNYTNLSKISTKMFVYNETIIIKKKKNEDDNYYTNMINQEYEDSQNVYFEPVPSDNQIMPNTLEKGHEINNQDLYKSSCQNEVAINPSMNEKEDSSKNEEIISLSPLQTLLKDQIEVCYEEINGIIFINVDDENNILKMNKRVFSKEGLSLNGVTNIADFLNLLRQIYINSTRNSTVPHLLCVMDHMLDREYGFEAVEKAMEQNKLLHLNMYFILLSSTEDSETLQKYAKIGVTQNVTKPLTKTKIKPVIEKFYNDIDEI